MKKLLLMLTFILSLFGIIACEQNIEDETSAHDEGLQSESQQRNYFSNGTLTVFEDEAYFSEDKVALYLYAYDELPPNYLRKQEAESLGWVPSQGNLWDVTDQGMIGGDYFGNREGLLPNDPGRTYYSADVNYDPLERDGRRGSERLVYSNDGLIFYTDDHYDSYEQLYGEE